MAYHPDLNLYLFLNILPDIIYSLTLSPLMPLNDRPALLGEIKPPIKLNPSAEVFSYILTGQWASVFFVEVPNVSKTDLGLWSLGQDRTWDGEKLNVPRLQNILH